MKKLIYRANYLTAVIAGLVTSVGLIIGDFVRKYFNLVSKDERFIFTLVIGMIFFIIPGIMFVFGFEYIIHRIKNFGSGSFFFPSSKEDIYVIIRMLIWFFTTSSVMVSVTCM